VSKWEKQDWLVLIHADLIGVAATVFLFHHDEPMNFATWATLCATLSGVYHWLLVRDAKIPDAMPNTLYPGGDP
jgi:hypothetical protein